MEQDIQEAKKFLKFLDKKTNRHLISECKRNLKIQEALSEINK